VLGEDVVPVPVPKRIPAPSFVDGVAGDRVVVAAYDRARAARVIRVDTILRAAIDRI